MAKGKKTGGRVKGSVNKTTAAVKEAIESAFTHLEESTDGFNAWAAENRTIFYTQLLPKIIPAQLMHAGSLDMVLNVLTGVPRDSGDADS